MHVLATVLLVLSSLATLVWLSRHLMIWRERKTGFTLTASYRSPDEAPLISVLVAAKDEEANIGECLRTLLTQDYPNFEVIVCNDRSTDRTGAIVSAIAQQDTRVRLMNIEHLPEGWFGKNNAMQTGIAASNGQWICMIDADCRQLSTRTLSVAMAYAQDKSCDLLSVLPVLEMKGFWENVVQPVCSGVMMIWFHPDKVNNPRKPNAYANGAFMLMQRDAYETVGTHEAVRLQANEDMHMAALVKAKGLALRVVRSEDLYVVRMYTSLRAILNGWSRIFYGTFGTVKRLSLSMMVMLVMGLLPYFTAAIALTAAANGASTIWLAAGLVGLTAAMLQISVIFRFYKLINGRPGLCWTYPIGCVITVVALVKSLTKLRRGAKLVWRSTAYATGVKS